MSAEFEKIMKAALPEIQEVGKEHGFSVRIVENKGTFYFYPELPAEPIDLHAMSKACDNSGRIPDEDIKTMMSKINERESEWVAWEIYLHGEMIDHYSYCHTMTEKEVLYDLITYNEFDTRITIKLEKPNEVPC